MNRVANRFAVSSPYQAPFFESMESRLLLSLTVPQPADITAMSNGSFMIPVYANDAQGPVSITAASSDPTHFAVNVSSGDQFAKLYYKGSQIWRAQVDSSLIGHTFTLSASDAVHGDGTVTYVVPADGLSENTVATNIAAAWNDASNPLKANIVAVADYDDPTGAAYVYLYEKIAGDTFSMAASGTGTWTGAGTVQNTFQGTVLVQLFASHPDAAAAVQQFIKLSTMSVSGTGQFVAGTPYYNGSPVHRNIDGFMTQTGTNSNQGTVPVLQDNFYSGLTFMRGAMGMANTGATNSSSNQFFIMDEQTNNLDSRYILFGMMLDEGAIVNGKTIFENVMSTPVVSSRTNLTSMYGQSPICAPVLDHVEILAADNPIAKGSGVVFVKPVNRAIGDVQVTITANDGTSTVDRTVNVRAVGIASLSDENLSPGETIIISPGSVKGAGGTYTWALASAATAGLTVTVDSATGQTIISKDASLRGLFPVKISLHVVGANNQGEDFVQTVYVLANSSLSPYLLPRMAAPSSGGSIFTTVRSKNILFESAYGGGTLIYDITDVNNPTLLSSIPARSSTTGNYSGLIMGLQVVGSTLFVCNSMVGIEAYNVKNPSQPVLIGVSDQPGVTMWDMKISGGKMYVAAGAGGVGIFDVRNPARMVFKGVIQRNASGSVVFEDASQMVLNGRYLYVGDRAGGNVMVVDLKAPLIVDRTYYPGRIVASLPVSSVLGMATAGKSLYAMSQYDGLHVIDITNPAALVARSTISVPNGTFLTRYGSMLLAGAQTGFVLYDISQTATPQELYTIPTGSFIGRADFHGRDLIVPLWDGGTMFIDLPAAVTKSGKFTDSSGVIYSVRISGGGTAYVYTSLAGMAGDVQRISVLGSTPKTSLKITTSRNLPLDVGVLTVDGSIYKLTARTTDVDGNVSIGGTARSVALGTMEGSELIIGGSLPEDVITTTVLSLGNVTDLKIDSKMPVSKLTVKQWIVTDVADNEIDVPSIGTLKSTGDFQANIGTAAESMSLGLASVGSLHDATWYVQTLSRLTVKGLAVDFTLRSDGNVGAITLGGAQSSVFYAGVGDGVTGLPTQLSDFVSDATIASLTLKPARGQAVAWASSILAAQRLGKVSISKADLVDADTTGLAAQTLTKFSYKDADPTHKYLWPNKLIDDALWPETFELLDIFQIDRIQA